MLGFAFAMIMNGNYRGRGLVRASVLIPWAIPTAVTAKLWYFIFAYNGIANTLLAHEHHLVQRQVGGPVGDHHRGRLEDDAVHGAAHPGRVSS